MEIINYHCHKTWPKGVYSQRKPKGPGQSLVYCLPRAQKWRWALLCFNLCLKGPGSSLEEEMETHLSDTESEELLPPDQEVSRQDPLLSWCGVREGLASSGQWHSRNFCFPGNLPVSPCYNIKWNLGAALKVG